MQNIICQLMIRYESTEDKQRVLENVHNFISTSSTLLYDDYYYNKKIAIQLCGMLRMYESMYYFFVRRIY